MPEPPAVQITPEEIIHLVLEEMEQGVCPSYYSNLVPSVFDILLFIDDLERLRPLEGRIQREAVRALNEKLAALNKADHPRLKLPGAAPKRSKKYETLGEWSVQLHENTDDDAREVPLVIHSRFPVQAGPDDRAGTMTERVTRRRSDGESSTTATMRSPAFPVGPPPGAVRGTLEYEDDSGPHSFEMTKDLIRIGRRAADRRPGIDLELDVKKDVSREHLRIRHHPESGRFFIEDVSTLGTTVNGTALTRNVETVLPAKAKIGLAGVLFLRWKASDA